MTINDINDQYDLCNILDASFVYDGIIDSHISSFNSFIETGIENIMTKIFKITFEYANIPAVGRSSKESDKNITKYVINVNITKINITNPVAYNYNIQKQQLLMPGEAALKDLTYCSPMYIDATITATAYLTNNTVEVKTEYIKNYLMAKIPIMVKSKLCNTYNKSKDTLYKLNESPTDMGGTFIVKGNNYIITNLESMKYNEPREFRHNKEHNKELARSDIISKPGGAFENSFRMLLLLFNNNTICINMNSAGFKDVNIPFYLLFGALGVTSRKKITEYITYSFDIGNPITKKMLAIINDAFQTTILILKKLIL